MSRTFALLGRFSVRFRWPIIALWIVVTVVCVMFCPPLSAVTKNATSSFLPSDVPSVQAGQLAGPFQNSSQAAATLVAVRDGAPLTAADESLIGQVEASITALPKVSVVRDLGQSGDGSVRQALIQGDVPAFGAGPESKALVDAVRAAFPADTGGLSFHLTGQVPTIVDNQGGQQGAQNSTQLFSILFILVLLLVAFRALLAPLVTLLPAGLVLALSGPAIAGATRMGVQASSVTQFLLIVLVLGAGTDYGLFLVFRVREELRRGLAPRAAVERAVATVGESITFSALTVMAALTSLVLAQFSFYQSVGPALAIGVGLMLLAGLTLLPALLAVLGRAVFWPTPTSPRAEVKGGAYASIAAHVARRPTGVLAVGVMLLGVLAVCLVGTGTSGFGDTAAAPGTDSAAGSAALAAHYPGTGAQGTAVLFGFTASIWDSPDVLTGLEQRLRDSGDFQSVAGPLDPNGVRLTPADLAALHAALGSPQELTGAAAATPPAGVSADMLRAYAGEVRFVSADGHTVQFSTVLAHGTATDAASLAAVPALRDHITAIATSEGATRAGAFGQVAFAYDVDHLSTSDLWRIIPVVAVLIALLLALAMRSLVAPLYLVFSVVLSYLAALGVTALIFVRLGGQSGLNFVLPFLMFIFLMALGSDYNILVMTRIREEARLRPLREAVKVAVGATGTTVTTAGVILGGTFAVLAMAAGSAAGSGQIRQIGYGIAVGVLMDTFLIRTILVPAMVVLLGRWNWWPSRLHASVTQPEAHDLGMAA